MNSRSTFVAVLVAAISLVPLLAEIRSPFGGPDISGLKVSAAVQSDGMAIHDIQGNTSTSPLVNNFVTTAGIVTAIRADGLFMEAPDAKFDSDPATSEGIFILSATAAGQVAIGDGVRVSGTVREIIDGAKPGLTRTVIANSPQVTVLSSGNQLPNAVTISGLDLNPFGPFDQLEKLESMRVRFDQLTVVAPTGGVADEPNATAVSDGIFWVILRGGRPLREPGIHVLDPLPIGAPAGIARFDGNPEVLRVDTSARPGTGTIDVPAGSRLVNLTGVLDQSPRAYTILPDPGFGILDDGKRATPVREAVAGEFTVASMNLRRFFDDVDNPATDDVVLSQQAYLARLQKASLAIRSVIRSPDIIAVQEIETEEALRELAERINRDTMAAGLPNPVYIARLVEGNDPIGLDVGFLVKSSRVTLLGFQQAGKDATLADPISGRTVPLNDRPPLVLRVAPIDPDGVGLPVTVIAANLLSLSNIDDAGNGASVRARRRAQAEFLAALIQAEQEDPANRIICLGDFNAFQFNDGYVDVLGTVTGNPPAPEQVVLASRDLVEPNPFNLIGPIAADQRYSSLVDGNGVALDHVLVSATMLARVSGFEFARFNAEFPDVLRGDAHRVERVSDRDIPVAYFNFQAGLADLEVTLSALPNPAPRRTFVTYTFNVTNHGPDKATGVVLRDSFSPEGIPIGLGGRDLNPGQSASIGVVRRVNEPVGSLVSNTAAISSNQIDPDPSNNSSTVVVEVVTAVPRIDFAILEGKKLMVIGVGFEDGARVEIDGNPQKTIAGDIVFLAQQSLIVKKGRKRIRPGQTVILTVVNPDGARSAPQPFTRQG